jgi:hypothetical protein
VLDLPRTFQEDLFWEKVVKIPDGCWLWTGAKTRDGYGTVAIGERTPRGTGKVLSTHRVAYILQHGGIPATLHVMHTCDTKLCVRGEHLKLGTRRDNMRDMWSKGRQRLADRTGEPRNKLSREQARQIRILFASGLFSRADLALRFGVRMTASQEVLQYKTWKE